MTESPGALIGLSNVMTRARSRAPRGPDLDQDPALRERLGVQAVRALEGREAYIHDAVIHGHRVRLYTNSHHLADFWRDNWPTEAEWLRSVGRAVPPRPRLSLYAAIDVSGQTESSCASAREGEVYLFNSSYYGDLRASALEALDRALSPGGARLLHGAAVELDGRGVVLLYPSEVIHPTPTWGLMDRRSARFVADGWFLRDGSGRIYAIEKHLYVRASVVRHYPAYAPALIRSKFENVPPPDGAADPVSRLAVSDDARAMVSPAALFGRERVLAGPLRPAAVVLLRAGAGGPPLATSADSFPCPAWEFHVGSIPGHPREVARAIAETVAP